MIKESSIDLQPIKVDIVEMQTAQSFNQLLIMVLLIVSMSVTQLFNSFVFSSGVAKKINFNGNQTIFLTNEAEEADVIVNDSEAEIILTNNELEYEEELAAARYLSAQDLDSLHRIVEAEATSEDIVGRIMVANVIFNRVDSKRFPNTVHDVIHQRINGRAQFSPIDDQRYFKVKVSAKTKKAVERALAGEVYVEDALFFMARSMASQNGTSWFDNNLTKVTKYGVHEFYKY